MDLNTIVILVTAVTGLVVALVALRATKVALSGKIEVVQASVDGTASEMRAELRAALAALAAEKDKAAALAVKKVNA